jgi:hypothetical protein
MKIKGTAILALPAFIKAEFPDRFGEWLNALPPASRTVHESAILAFNYFDVIEALYDPTRVMCDLFYEGDQRGAWHSGRYSAGYALNGFYKVFFRIGSPQFIIDRASRVFNDYYPEGEMRVVESSTHRCVLQIVKLPAPHWVADMNVWGWADGALELMGKKERQVAMTLSMSAGDAVTEYHITWK